MVYSFTFVKALGRCCSCKYRSWWRAVFAKITIFGLVTSDETTANKGGMAPSSRTHQVASEKNCVVMPASPESFRVFARFIVHEGFYPSRTIDHFCRDKGNRSDLQRHDHKFGFTKYWHCCMKVLCHCVFMHSFEKQYNWMWEERTANKNYENRPYE